MPTSTLCPACGQEAPIVYRGVLPQCTACGAIRPPLSSASLNLAGKPSRLGGVLAAVAAGIVVVFGAMFALAAALLLLALGRPIAAVAFGATLGLLTLFAAWSLSRRARKLAASASATESALRSQALLAMAAHRGAVTARDAAQALGTSVAEADAMLTALAKADPERVGVDVDDQGNVWYRVAAAPGEPLPHVRVGPAVRVEGDAGAVEAREQGESAEALRGTTGPRPGSR